MRHIDVVMIHKIQYFEVERLAQGVFLQDIVNNFLAEKGENVIAVHPVMGTSIIVHYKE
ncbi:MAG TPA: hypothetical protein VMW55_01880 [Nitrosopumilaceae archaeon]|nr:hypothetical protein [Nitrosopumilaceae archaeon]